MISLYHFIRLAARSLRGGGQRVLVALLCIAFGVMSLVSMTMLANSIAGAIQLPPAQLLGGDFSIGRQAEDALRPQDIDQLDALRQTGEISAYTLIAFNNTSILFRTPGSGEMHFAANGMGIQPDRYPLAGSLTIGQPGSTGLPTLLQQVGDVVIARDLAEEYNLKVGDALFLSDLRVGVPLAATLRGVAYDTPNHQGGKLYYSIATAQKLADGLPVVNTAIVNTSQPEALSAKLEGSGWSVEWAAGRGDTQTANVWMLGLRGAGILGLLVGGIGIANTMQVLLRRRQREIAVWKTLGYRQGHLRLIFSLEAGLLGLGGSLLGSGLGILVSTGLLELFRRTSSLLYQWTFSPGPPLTGVLVGTLTTVIFAYWAIVISSQARPAALLRSESIAVRALPGCQLAMLGLLLAALFTALTGLAMESLAAGAAVLAGIGIGLAVLAAFFSGMLRLCARLLPLHRFPLARLGIQSLRRRGLSLVFAMVALFVGVLSMSLGLAVAQITGLKTTGGPGPSAGYNLEILGDPGSESAIRQALAAQNPQKVGLGYRTTLAGLSVIGDTAPTNPLPPVLEGRTGLQDIPLSGAAWGSQPDGVYAPQWVNLNAGSQVKAVFDDGTTRIFTVVGSYQTDYRSLELTPPTGLLMPAEAFSGDLRPDSLTFFVQVAPNQLSQAEAALGQALPQATVVDLEAYASRYMVSAQRLYVLPVVMAGLALLAGLLLVANSVSLAMLDRRYEIGILKTVGYSRRQILSIFAVEYGLVGLLATGAGTLAIQGLLAALAMANQLPAGILMLSIPSLALLALCGVGLTLLTVLGVTWQPTGVSPVFILNERN